MRFDRKFLMVLTIFFDAIRPLRKREEERSAARGA